MAYLSISAIIDRSPEARAMAAVWWSCEDAGLDVPDEVREFFGQVRPEPEADVAEERRLEGGHHAALTPWSDGDVTEGYVVDLGELPEGTRSLRVSVSY